MKAPAASLPLLGSVALAQHRSRSCSMSLDHGGLVQGDPLQGREPHRRRARRRDEAVASPEAATPEAAAGDNASDLAAGEITDGDILEQHIRALRRYAYALVGGAPIADDLVQET